ncbi:MAG: thiamine phosphate synthase [Candidatus Saccharimonadales bacterium]
MTKSKIDYSVYVLTNMKLAGESTISGVVKLAIDGGATVIQYREKEASTGVMINEALAIQAVTKAAGVPLIINDRIDVALAIDADGVHVGQSDMPAILARKLIGPNKILGVSARTPEQVASAIAGGADYLGIGDIFGTTTKKGTVVIGLEKFKQLVELSSVPVVGIGGVTKDNATGVIESGADGIAVISAVFGKDDPENETRRLMEIIKKAKIIK